MSTHVKQIAIAVGIVIGLAAAWTFVMGCAKANVAPDAQQAYKQAQAQKISHDFTRVVIQANKDGRLTDALTETLLRINKQVSDVIAANPQGWLEQAKTVAKNGREALPPDLQLKIGALLDSLIQQLSEVR